MNQKQANEEKVCPVCGQTFYGRKDKQFCGVACKNRWHNRILQQRRKYRSEIVTILARNYQILDGLLVEHKSSAALTELEKAGFDPAFITGHRRGRYGHDDCACFDIRFYRTNTRIFNIRRKSLTER
jgi:hypothetical protein